MRIRDLLAAESIELNGSAAGKQDVLNKMVDLMAKSGKIRDVETYRKGVFAREEEGTTGIGEGIAIPHCKSDAVKAPGLAAMVVKDGVEFDALDGAPVNLLFLIAAPNTEDNVHLEVLSKLSVLLMDENFTNGLKNAKTVDEFLKVIDDAESAKDEDEKEDETGAKYKVLAVTGCPTAGSNLQQILLHLWQQILRCPVFHLIRQFCQHITDGICHSIGSEFSTFHHMDQALHITRQCFHQPGNT